MPDYFVDVNKKEKSVRFTGPGTIVIDNKQYEYRLEEINDNYYLLRLDNRVFRVNRVSGENNNLLILIEGRYFETEIRTNLEQKAHQVLSNVKQKNHHSLIKSPMPGMVLKLKKNAGDEVAQGESIMILEAMKMENDIKSPFSGFIKEIYVSEHSAVEKGAKLFLIG
ncbi:MAG: acetyl-CoA carboxylase biotin carboxyl carrier protein subunit [Bacteroidetes bacterium]|nr:acetyl-CoA carboxylase biotin carboxyl carrier protein subunit [Bacteroidota bacterium]